MKQWKLRDQRQNSQSSLKSFASALDLQDELSDSEVQGGFQASENIVNSGPSRLQDSKN